MLWVEGVAMEYMQIGKETDKHPIGGLILDVLNSKLSVFLNYLPKTHFHFFPYFYRNLHHAPVQDSQSMHPLRQNPDIKTKAKRQQTYYELCGQRNKLAEYFYRLDNNLLDPKDPQEADDGQNPKLQLSHRFSRTVEHKPILDDEELKPLSSEQLDNRYFYLFLEGKTVTQEHDQAYFDYMKDNFKFPMELEGENKRLIDEAIVRLTGAGTLLGADDEGKLRDIARQMVDSRLTDRKKQMIVLKQGLNQTQISERLTEIEGKIISPKVISKTLSTIKH